LPSEKAAGVTPTTAESGAAAATTKKTMWAAPTEFFLSSWEPRVSAEMTASFFRTLAGSEAK
jgi:hypothetical protein